MASPLLDLATQTAIPAPGSLIPETCLDPATVVWMCFCSVLVLGMMPALGLFEAGLLRSHNTVSVLTQIYAGVSVLSLIWFAFGYSAVFGETQKGFIGNPATFAFAQGFQMESGFHTCFPGTNLPRAIHFIFQMMFAAITPLLLTGAIAERFLFRPFLWFIVLFEIFVYIPVAHWVWHPEGWLAVMGARDFAGGIVIHTTAGCASVCLGWLLGAREVFKRAHGHVAPSSVPLTTIGGMMLWVGWFAFNAGSALGNWTVTVDSMVNTQLASCAGGFAALVISSAFAKPSVVAVLNGAIAGLAGVTPACGFIDPHAAVVVGFICGAIFFAGEQVGRHVIGLDDALDVGSVHGLPGIIGSLSTGLLAARGLGNARLGVIYGGSWYLLGVQTLAVVVAAAWAIVWTFIIYFFLKFMYLGHVSATTVKTATGLSADMWGLDFAEHGIVAYFTEAPPEPTIGIDSPLLANAGWFGANDDGSGYMFHGGGSSPNIADEDRFVADHFFPIVPTVCGYIRRRRAAAGYGDEHRQSLLPFEGLQGR